METPNIDDIAQKGIKFNNAFSASDFTAPSFLSIFSGLYPSEHGMIDWKKKSRSIQQILDIKNKEYKIQGFTSFRFIKQLLQNSMDIMCIGSDLGEYWDINQHLMVTEQVIKFLDENKKENFFLFYHHSAPHAPYRFPKSELQLLKKDNEFQFYLKRFKTDKIINAMFPQMNNGNIKKIFQTDEEAKKQSSIIAKTTTGMLNLDKDQANFIRYLYKKEVEWTDKLLGKILIKMKELDLQKNTIISFLADHGELLSDKGKFGHANDYMYNEVLKIPFILYTPTLKNNQVVDTNVSHVNVMPTILDMIGVKLNKKMKNRSLWKELQNNRKIPQQPVYSEGNFRIAVIKDNIKYITDTKRKSQIIGIGDFLKESLKLIPNVSDSNDELRDNFIRLIVPYYKRLMGIPKEQFFKINQNIEELIKKPQTSIKREMLTLVDDYFNMEKFDLTEDLNEEELRIIKVRLEALGYLDKKL